MNLDTELESWKQEWREPSGALPDAKLDDLKRKIKKQDRRTAIAIVTVCVCLAISTFAAWRLRTAFLEGLASGIWFASLTVGAYAWSVKRGTWKPTAETTAAYIELSYKRAVARARTARFIFWMIVVATILYGCFLVWDWKGASPRFISIFAAMVAETFWLYAVARKGKRAVETTRKLMESSRESVTDSAREV